MEKPSVPVRNFFGEASLCLAGLYTPDEIKHLVFQLLHALKGWNRAEVVLNMENTLEPDEVDLISGQIRLLREGTPLQYVTGKAEFLGLSLQVAPGVLIPRPETEELVELMIRENRQFQYADISILDIGTGSGCIAIALKRAFPYSHMDALDISGTALSLARANALKHKADIRFRKMDILDAAESSTLPGYTFIISNPPYVTESERPLMHPNVVLHEPAEALFVPDKAPLLFYRAIAAFAYGHLIRPGVLYVEINERFGDEVRKLLLAAGFERAAIISDLNGKPRFARGEVKTSMRDQSYWMADKGLP